MLLVVAATAVELGDVEGATLACGIGPVEAAIATAAALREGEVAGVLHVGIAGARGIEPPGLVIGSAAVYVDLVDPASVVPRVVRAEPDPRFVELACAALPEAHVLPIATSARVGGADDFQVEAMEGFSVLRAAALAGVPAVEVRAISNDPAEPDRSRWRLGEALEALTATLPRLVDALREAASRPPA